jgi:hypothetical protein
MLKSYFSGRNFAPKKALLYGGAFQNTGKVLQSKNPLYFGEPRFLTTCESQVISLAWRELHVISLQPTNFLVRETLPFTLTHPTRSNQYNLEIHTRECTVSSAFHPRPPALPAVHESEATDNSAFPYTEHPPQQAFHFSRCPAAEVFYHPWNGQKCPAAWGFALYSVVEWTEMPCHLVLYPTLNCAMH